MNTHQGASFAPDPMPRPRDLYDLLLPPEIRRSARLNPLDKMLYQWVRSWALEFGTEVRASYADIRRDLGPKQCSRSARRLSADRLAELGLLAVSGGEGRHGLTAFRALDWRPFAAAEGAHLAGPSDVLVGRPNPTRLLPFEEPPPALAIAMIDASGGPVAPGGDARCRGSVNQEPASVTPTKESWGVGAASPDSPKAFDGPSPDRLEEIQRAHFDPKMCALTGNTEVQRAESDAKICALSHGRDVQRADFHSENCALSGAAGRAGGTEDEQFGAGILPAGETVPFDGGSQNSLPPSRSMGSPAGAGPNGDRAESAMLAEMQAALKARQSVAQQEFNAQKINAHNLPRAISISDISNKVTKRYQISASGPPPDEGAAFRATEERLTGELVEMFRKHLKAGDRGLDRPMARKIVRAARSGRKREFDWDFVVGEVDHALRVIDGKGQPACQAVAYFLGTMRRQFAQHGFEGMYRSRKPK